MRIRPRVRVFKRDRSPFWYLAYFDASGIKCRESTGCTARRAAEAVAAQRELELADPNHAAQDSATLLGAVESFLRRVSEDVTAGERSSATLNCYQYKAGHLLRVFEHGGDGKAPRVPFHLRSMSAKAVDDYISLRRRETVVDHTIHKELTTLRLVLKLAKRHRLWSGDLDSVMPESFSPKYEPKSRALTPDELNRLFAEMTAGQGARVAFIIATSANWGESERARREDVAEGRSEVYLRGTKTAYRERTVPIVAPWQMSLLQRAMEAADGHDGAMFVRWSNARRDIYAACERAKIEPCSPNDLRRTTGTWLRQQGVPAEIIGQGVMGHRDGRMMERVYGRMTTDTAKALLAQHLGQKWVQSGSDSVQNSALGGLGGQSGDANTRETTENPVPRAGIEPATRGFSGPVGGWAKARVSTKTPHPVPRSGSGVGPTESGGELLTLPRLKRAGGAR